MKTILLVTADEELRARLVRPLADRSIFFAESDEAGLKMLRLAQVDLIIKDATSPLREIASFTDRARELSPLAVVVGVADDPATLADVDYVLPCSFAHQDLANVLRRAGDRHRLLHEVATLRPQAASRPTNADRPSGSADMPASVLEQALKEFAGAMAAGFDLSRMLEQFLDAIGDMVRPSRSAILLPSEAGVYRVSAHRGFAPQIVESIQLPGDTGLPDWLAREGRVLDLDEARERETTKRPRELARDLGLLQAVVAIPLIARGDLVGILTLGERVVGGRYGRRETELLFVLASQFGTAVRDIGLHHQLQREKEFNEQILAHMSSGVITIGRDETVSTMNQRAQEILDVPVREVINRDLRALPSPIGDLLFETFSRRRGIHRTEVQLALRNLPLEISTYPIQGDDLQPLGAVIVFEDLSAQKALTAEKRQAEQLQLLTRVIARIADEIKNPLVSVNTLMELLEERYDDPDFRRHFSTVVRRDVRRLMQVFERLTALVTETDLTFEAVDVRTVVDETLANLGARPAGAETAGAMLLQLADETSGKHLLISLYHEATSQLVKADRSQLGKAIGYIVWYVLHKSPGDRAKLSISLGRGEEEDVQVLLSSRTARLNADELPQLFDPMRMVQENLIEIGPTVSQRIVESLGGRLQVRQSRHELSFLMTLPVTPQ